MEKRQLTALATKAIAGDKEAFEELYLEHARSILFHVRSLIVDKDNCYDVAQDAIYKMYMNISKLREPAAFRGWMHQVIRTVCADHNKQVLTKESHTSLADNEQVLEEIRDEGEGSDPEAAALATMEGNQLFAIVNELPSNYREIIVQRYYDDMSYKEIADALQISVSNVSTRLQRATEAIRKKLEEMDTQHQNKDEDIEYKGTNLKASLISGITLLFPDDTVVAFTSAAHERLFGAAASTVATAAATVLQTKFGSKLIIAIVCVCGVAAGVLGSLAIIDANEREQGTTITNTETFDYNGSAHIVFVDQEKGNSDRNVTTIILVQEEGEASSVEWSLYWLSNGQNKEEGKTSPLDESLALKVSQGVGQEIDQTILQELDPGYYVVVFTLTDSNQAIGQARRSFRITF